MQSIVIETAIKCCYYIIKEATFDLGGSTRGYAKMMALGVLNP